MLNQNDKAKPPYFSTKFFEEKNIQLIDKMGWKVKLGDKELFGHSKIVP
jgi:hypothetical protein